MKSKLSVGLLVCIIIAACASSSTQTLASPFAYPAQIDNAASGGNVSQPADSAIHPLADNPISPTQPVKLIFIHHSTGGNWLADPNEDQPYGGLGRTLMENNYSVSATNYDWGPDGIGNNTDIGQWWDWFRGDNRDAILTALYNEGGQNIGEFGAWPRFSTAPSGENVIVMFKGCFPNAHLSGNPGDPPNTGDNPLRGQGAWISEGVPNPNHTVANAKGIYNDILQYFATRQDKLFIVMAGPPLTADDIDYPTDAAHAANYRALNDWLVNDWLDGYPHNNVAVFNYYNVLTSNGGDIDTNDAGAETGNHHRWWNGAVQYVHPVNNDFSAYAVGADAHPSTAGQQKATAEFVQLLNVYYNRWKGGTPPTQPALTLTQPNGGESWRTGSQQPIRWTTTGVVTQVNLYYSTDNLISRSNIASNITNTNVYTWTTPVISSTSVKVRVESVVSPATVYDVSDANFTLYTPGALDKFVYLPLVLNNHAIQPPSCLYPLTAVAISGYTTGYTNTNYTFTANPAPSNATTPIAYAWSPAPGSGQGTASAAYQWNTTGTKTITVTASNCGGTASDVHTIAIQAPPSGNLVQPGDLIYLGAFRLPDDRERPYTFEYGGDGMTFNPSGNLTSTDSCPGSLFIMGHDRTVDDVPNGNQVAEITIPEPIVSSNLDALNYAGFIQGFQGVITGRFAAMSEIPRVGMQYLNHPATGPKIHLGWGQHMPLDTPAPTHGWFDPNLSSSPFQGEWFIGDPPLDNANGYMLEIPAAWADANASGRYLGAGRFRDGGWSGMGPALFAYRPWLPDGSAPVSGTHLANTRLLQYEDSRNTENIERCLTNYQHPDEWEGGAWITTNSGKTAVLFAGTKSNGAKYWYGYVNPAGTDIPCVEGEMVGQFTVCRLANGAACPTADLTECAGHTSNRGWWSAHFDAQFILYDPADLARVAAGTIESWQPQPYAVLDIDEHLFLNPAGIEPDMLGAGVQRRYRIGEVAYDRDHGLLYVVELYADEAKPVVHVWRVQ